MSPHFERGRILLGQGRWAEAEARFRQALADEQDDPVAHAFLALALVELDRCDDAEEQAHEAIRCGPDLSFPHFASSVVLCRRGRWTEAKQAIDEALAIDPHDALYFSVLASIHMAREQWRDALAAADAGLQCDPEHAGCTNHRARALVMLGEKEAAAATMSGALERRPDDADTHANQGWALLHRGDPRRAAEHFREALRLEPANDWARAGMLEALKARNPAYRRLLAFFLWMARLSPGARWGIFLGGFFGSQFVGDMARRNPPNAALLWTVFYAYLVFALATWIGPGLFNLVMRFDRFGRHLLDDDDRLGTVFLGACLGTALTVLALSFVFDSGIMRIGALYLAILSIPATSIASIPVGWPRWTMIGATAILALMALSLCVPLERLPDDSLVAALFGLAALGAAKCFTWGAIGSQFLANWLAGVRTTR